MVAVISGSGLGVFGSSVASLGGVGNTGTAGRGNDRIFVNTTSGNLVVQSRDERLAALGLDLNLVRTYNSQGLLDDDNGDNWRLGVHQRLYNLTGIVNTAGSRVTKMFGDAREVIYEYDTARSAYVSSEGEGAHDTLTFAANSWTWQEGSSHVAETYDSEGRLTASTDADGNTVSYTYTGSLLTRIVDASGQTTELQYAGNNLVAIHVSSDGVTATLTTYQYDSSSRLSSVTVDLTPQITADAQVYVTSYTYEGASRRIASITQTDGSSVSFTYELIDGQYRVKTYTDGENRVTTFNYSQPTGGGGGQTAVASANGSALSTSRTTSYGLNTGALTANTASWTVADRLELDPGHASAPQLAFDSAGNGIVVWAQNGNVLARRYTASTATWSAAVVLDSRSDTTLTPVVSLDRQTGNAVVAWVQSNGVASSLYVNRFDAASNSWGTAQLVESTNGEVSGTPAVSISGTRAAVTWRQHDDTAYSIFVARLDNGTWSSATVVDTTAQQVMLQQTAIDSNGNISMVWREFSTADSEYRIAFRRWDNATQTFGAVTYLDNDGDRQPRLMFDAQGNGFALWGGGAQVRRYDAATGQWGAQVSLNIGEGNALAAELAVDAAGNALVVWPQDDGVALSLYASRYDAATRQWSAATLVETSNGPVSTDTNFAVALVGNEGVVTWVEPNGTESNIYAARLTAGVWGPATLLETRTEPAQTPTAAIDAAGNTTIVWVQADGSARSIYYAQIVAPYYIIPSGASWQSLANTLYGVSSAAAGNALQAAMGGGAATAGRRLSGLPATLNVVTTVPAYYTVRSGDTWAHIAQAVYGTTDDAAIAALRTQLTNPALTAGLELTVPANLTFTSSSLRTAPVAWSQTGNTQTQLYNRNSGLLTTPAGTWQAAQQLDTKDVEASAPRVSFDEWGNGFAIWAQGSEVLVRRYTVATGTWSPEVAIDTRGEEAHQPLLAVDWVSGNAVAAWVQSDGAAESLYVSRYNSQTNTWSTPQALEASSAAVSMWPDGGSISINGNHAAIAWLQADGTVDNVYLARLESGTWTAPVLLESNATVARQPQVAVDAEGNATILWRQFSSADGEYRIYSRRWNNATQSFATAQTLDGAGDRYPKIGFDAQGNGFAVWGGGAEVRRFDAATGEWGPQITLANVGGAWGAQLSVDPDGNAVVVWAEDDGTVISLYARIFDVSTGTWGATTLLENTSDPVDLDGNFSVSYVYGRAVVAWASSNGTTVDAYAVRYDSNGWSTPTLLETSATRVNQFSTVIDTAGNATVLWIQPDDWGPSVYQARFDRTPYYTVPSGATWQSIANTIYGVNSVAAGEALREALGSPTLVTGAHLTLFPPVLAVTTLTTPYYEVQSGDTWLQITERLYGTSEPTAVSALQTLLGHPALTVGARFQTPGTLQYVSGGQGPARYLQTEITDARGVVTRYEQDANGRLQAVTVAPTGLALRTEYEYDDAGNLTAIVEDPTGLNRRTSLSYDGNGNLLRRRDSLGNTVERTYDNNLLLTETVYTVADPDGDGSATPSGALTTHYSYDGERHLRFVVSAAGRVTEYRYDSTGERTRTLTYTGAAYSGSTFTTSQLSTWAAAQDQTRTQRIDYAYDFRGNVASVTAYDSTDASGNGIGNPSITRFVYDQRGQLLQTLSARGNNNVPDAGNQNLPYATTYTYDGLGRVLTTTQWLSDGNITTSVSQYSDATRMTAITAANGLVTTTLYNRVGEVIHVAHGDTTSPSSLGTTTYTYDQAGRLRVTTAPIEPNNPTRVRQFFFYDDAGRKIGAVDADGTVTEYIHDDLGHVIKTVQYSTRLGSATLASLIDSNGNPTTVAFSTLRTEASATPALDRIARNVYDASGALVYVIDEAGAVTRHSYDGAGRLISSTRHFATVTIARSVDQLLPADVVVGTNADDRMTRIFYDADGLKVATLDGEGALVSFSYDAGGRLIRQIAHANTVGQSLRASGTFAQLLSSVDTDDETGTDPERDAITDYIYDGQGRRIGTHDAEGYLIELVYDVDGNVVERIRYDQRLAHVSEPTVTALRNQVLPASVRERTSYSYNNNGQVLSEVVSRGTSTSSAATATSYVYDTSGRLISATRADGSTESRTTQTRYDLLGRVLQELTAEGYAQITTGMTPAQINDIWNRYSVTYSYDLGGRRISATSRPNDTQTNVTRYYYDEDGRLRFEVNARGERVEYRYNDLNQLKQEIRYTNRISTSGLTGGLLTPSLASTLSGNTNPDSDSLTTYTYTLTGRVESKRVARTSITAEDTLRTYAYNAFGELRTETDSYTVATQYTYNKQGLLTQTIADVGSLNITQSRTYDVFGRLRTVTDGRQNIVQRFEYDRLGRTVATTDSSTTDRTVIAYDAFSRRLTVTDALNNVTSYHYNDANRSMTVVTPENISVTTVLSRHGQTLTVTAAGNTTVYQYDRNGQVTGISDNLGSLESRTYDRAGRQVTQTGANGAVTSLAYDEANRVLTRTVDSGAGGLQLVTTYTYDGQGRVTRVDEPGGRRTDTSYYRDGRVKEVAVDPLSLNLRTFYTYDREGRVSTVTEGYGSSNPRVVQYQYDHLGRRTSEIVDPGTGTNPATGRLYLNLETLYRYDANGNVTRKIDAETHSTWYVYDADNRLTHTIDALGGVTRTFYDAENHVTETRRYATALNPATLAGNDAPTAAQVALSNNSLDAVSRSFYDRDGRERFTINALGIVTERVFDENGYVTRSRVIASPRLTGTYANAAAVQTALNAVAANNIAAEDRVSWTAYDLRGRATFTVDASGAVTRLLYDNAGNVVEKREFVTLRSTGAATDLASLEAWAAMQVSNGLNRTTRYWYDSTGRLRFTLNAQQYLIEQRYNDAGREDTRIVYANPQNIASAVTLADLVAGTNGGAISVNTDKDQSVRTLYDAAGRVARVTDLFSNHYEEFTYDARGDKVSFRNKSGAVWNYTYDANGRLLEEISPAVAVTTITESGASLINNGDTTVRIVTRLTYDNLGNVETRTEGIRRAANGSESTTGARTTSYLYDALGRQTRTTFPSLNVYNSASGDGQFGANGGSITRTETATQIYTEIAYDTLGNAFRNRDVAGNYSYKVYDVIGRVTHEIDALNGVTAYDYDAFGNQKSITRHANALSSTPWTTVTSLRASDLNLVPSGADRTIQQQWDNLNRLIRVEQPQTFNYLPYAGTTSTGARYTLAAHTITDYNAFGEVSRTRQLISPDNYADTYFYYDRMGRRSAEVGPLNHLTTYEYDESGDLKRKVEYARPVTGAVNFDSYGTVVTTTRNNAPGAAEGYDRETIYEYDRLNRLVKETKVGIEYTDPLQTNLDPEYGDQVTTYGYDAVGNRTRMSRLNVLNGTNAVTAETFTYYDVLGRVIAIAEPTRDRGDGAQLTPFTLMRRDAYGNLVEEIKFANSATSVSESGYTLPTSNTNTVTGDRITRMLVDGHNNVIRTEDGAGVDRYASYNARGQVEKEWQQVTNTDGSTTISEYLSTIYKYDAVGRQIRVIEPQRYNGASTIKVERATEYNVFGEVTYKGIVDATGTSGREELFQYDAAGRLWRTNSGDGVTKVYLYDLMGNSTAEIRSQTVNLFTAVGSAVDALNLSGANQMRVETRYDALGRAVERREASFTAEMPLQAINGAFSIDSNGAWIRWNEPGIGVIAVFEYRIAGSTDAYSEMAVQSLGGGRVGVSTGTLAANINYEYRVRYTNFGENLPFGQATGNFQVNGTSAASLTTTQDAFDAASEVAALSAAQGQGGVISWAAPSDTSVIPYFYIKLAGAPDSAWQLVTTLRNSGTFQAQAQTQMRTAGDYDFKIVYRRTVNSQQIDIAGRTGTLRSTGASTQRVDTVAVNWVNTSPPFGVQPSSVPTGTATAVGAIIQNSEKHPKTNNNPAEWWPGTNYVQLSWEDIGAGQIMVELDYMSESWWSYARREGMTDIQMHDPRPVYNRQFPFSSGATGATLTWETATRTPAGGISSVLAVRVYKLNAAGQWSLVYSQPNPGLSPGRSAQWTGPIQADDYSFEIAPAGTSNYTAVPMLRSSGEQFGVDLKPIPVGNYNYRITYRQGNRIIAQQTGSVSVGSSAVSFSASSNATYPPTSIQSFSTSGATLSWSHPKENASDRVVVSYSAGGYTTTRTLTGAGPNFTLDFSDDPYPNRNGSFNISYFRANESTAYAVGSGGYLHTIADVPVAATVSVTAQQQIYPSGLVQISRPTDLGNNILRWTTPAEAGAAVVFSYESEPGIWKQVPATWTGSEFRVDLSAARAGTFRYQITYTRPLAAHLYAITSGQMTLSRSVGVTSVSLTDTTSGSQANVVTPRTQQKMDRWGNVIQVINAAQQVTDYRFNSMDQLLETRLPLAEILATNTGTNSNQASSSNARATTRNYYDLNGRLIATQDGNGNVNRTTSNAVGQNILERHADTGTKKRAYDAFGQEIQVTDELDYRTRKEYDRAGQLVRVAREFISGAFGAPTAPPDVIPDPSATGIVVDRYTYDEAGRRTAEINGLGETTRYFYDLNGNVTRRLSAMGRQTLYEYDANDKRTRETDGNGLSQSWSYDYFGRIRTHEDLGGADYTYTYDNGNNYAGLLTSITSTLGQNTTYGYDAAGRVISIVDAPNAAQANAAGLVAVSRTTTYGYDFAGRRAREATAVDGVTHQNTTIEYDALGRISQLNDLRYETKYHYDGAGNRTRIEASYYDDAMVQRSQDLWYTYDVMNRVLVSQGRNTAGVIDVDLTAATAQGTRLTYDLAGQRKTAQTYGKKIDIRIRNRPGGPGEPGESFEVYQIIDGITLESYTYDGMGRLLKVGKDGRTVTNNTYDKASRETTSIQADLSFSTTEKEISSRTRTTNYDSDGFTTTQTTTKNGVAESTVTFGTSNPFDSLGYDAAGILRNYTVAVQGGSPYTTTYTFDYRHGDSYQEIHQHAQSTSGLQTGDTYRTYTQNGELYSFTDSRAPSNNRYFTNRQGGDALTVLQGAKSEHFFYANDHQIGSYGQLQDASGNFKANFDVNYTPISGEFPLDAPAQVIVQAGDTLRILAMRTFGDGDLWYLIADANGMSQGPDQDLSSQVGWSLRVPNEVVSISNTANSFKPYNMADALGDTTPTQPLPPPPKKKGCGVIGQILVIVVAIVVTYFTAGALTGAFASLGATGSAVATAAVSAAAGSVASQGVAIAIGQQDGFSWKSVAASALTGGILKGAGVGDLFGANPSFGQAALQGAINSSVSQGVNIALGLQKSFSWRELAISGLSSAVANEVTPATGQGIYDATRNGHLAKLGMGVSSSVTSAVVRRSLGGRMDTDAVLADVFGNALGNSITDKLAARGIGQPRAGNKSDDEIPEVEVIASRSEAGTDAAGASLDRKSIIRSGSERSPDEIAAATAANTIISGEIETVVSTAKRWRVGEENHYWTQQFTHRGAFGQFMSEDDATSSAVELYAQDRRDQLKAIQRHNDAILLDGFSPIGHVKNAVVGTFNLGIKALSGLAALEAMRYGSDLDTAVSMVDRVNSLQIDADAPFADMLGKSLAPAIDDARTWSENTFGVGASMALGVAGEFALDALALAGTGGAARRLVPELDLALGSNSRLLQTAASDDAAGLFRRTKNVGVFAELKVPMQMRYVDQAAVEGGVGLQGVNVRIVRDPDLVGRNMYGYTHPDGSIDLYPDAFTDTEQLVKTLGHERTHTMQIDVFGHPNTHGVRTMEELNLNEIASHGIEDSFWQYYLQNRSGKLEQFR